MNTPAQDVWSSIAQTPQYQELLRSKRAFIFPTSIFFIAYYFALLVLVGWWPDLMKKPVLGPVNVAYLFALSQFFMAWSIAFVYVRKASEWDKQAKYILDQQELGGGISAKH